MVTEVQLAARATPALGAEFDGRRGLRGAILGERAAQGGQLLSSFGRTPSQRRKARTVRLVAPSVAVGLGPACLSGSHQVATNQSS